MFIHSIDIVVLSISLCCNILDTLYQKLFSLKLHLELERLAQQLRPDWFINSLKELEYTNSNKEKKKKRINDLKCSHINTNILYLSDSLHNNNKTKEDTYIIYKTRDVTKRTNDESCFCINLFLFYFWNEDNSRQFC